MSKSRIEKIFEAICNGETVNIKPESRIEKFLLGLACGETVEDAPRSRVEAYLAALCQKGLGGGSDGELKLPENARLYYIGTAASAFTLTSGAFESSAIGELTSG